MSEPNKRNNENKWTPNMIKMVWQKGTVITNHPKEQWRLDKHGMLMYFDHYDKMDEAHGWHIGNITKDLPSLALNNVEPVNNRNLI